MNRIIPPFRLRLLPLSCLMAALLAGCSQGSGAFNAESASNLDATPTAKTLGDALPTATGSMATPAPVAHTRGRVLLYALPMDDGNMNGRAPDLAALKAVQVCGIKDTARLPSLLNDPTATADQTGISATTPPDITQHMIVPGADAPDRQAVGRLDVDPALERCTPVPLDLAGGSGSRGEVGGSHADETRTGDRDDDSKSNADGRRNRSGINDGTSIARWPAQGLLATVAVPAQYLTSVRVSTTGADGQTHESRLRLPNPPDLQHFWPGVRILLGVSDKNCPANKPQPCLDMAEVATLAELHELKSTNAHQGYVMPLDPSGRTWRMAMASRDLLDPRAARQPAQPSHVQIRATSADGGPLTLSGASDNMAGITRVDLCAQDRCLPAERVTEEGVTSLTPATVGAGQALLLANATLPASMQGITHVRVRSTDTKGQATSTTVALVEPLDLTIMGVRHGTILLSLKPVTPCPDKTSCLTLTHATGQIGFPDGTPGREEQLTRFYNPAAGMNLSLANGVRLTVPAGALPEPRILLMSNSASSTSPLPAIFPPLKLQKPATLTLPASTGYRQPRTLQLEDTLHVGTTR